ILAHLMGGERGLDQLIDAVGLSKNAVVNHLSQLVEGGLVHRPARGRYALTLDGADLMNAVARMFRDSTSRSKAERERLGLLYANMRKGEIRMRDKLVTRRAEYQCSWLSFLGATAGVLTAMGKACDTVETGGSSGYAFLLNLRKEFLCPSGPTAIHDRTFKEMLDGIGDLGAAIRYYGEEGGVPTGDRMGEMDLIRARSFFEVVSHGIDDTDLPAVVWGIPIPEWGIVNGYEGDAYIVSTIRNEGRPEPPFHYSELNAPGCLSALFFRLGEVRPNDRTSLERGMRMGMGKIEVAPGYVAGTKAYDLWADLLHTSDDSGYFGHSYMTQCWASARGLAGAYLERLSERQVGSRRRLLKEASQAYAEEALLLTELGRLFPFSFKGEMDEPKRVRGATLIMEAKGKDEDALVRIKEALSLFK
ncbi:MAG: winged helix-turn-helix domain-containing protein, partial [Methanomassiliicoccales archaeon]|nr:winged helix-turn-helix domain-containing protein [Methanomassiliicoccales archaeon]